MMYTKEKRDPSILEQRCNSEIDNLEGNFMKMQATPFLVDLSVSSLITRDCALMTNFVPHAAKTFVSQLVAHFFIFLLKERHCKY
jgi:hypothetical protein